MRGAGIAIDLAYTSLLKRALRTLWIVLDEMGLVGVPVIQSWRLNERSYGSFEGLCLDEAEEIYGAEQVRVWRKSFHHRFPARPEGVSAFRRGHRRTNPIAGPPSSSESLKEVQERLLPLWQEKIAADLEEGGAFWWSPWQHHPRPGQAYRGDIRSGYRRSGRSQCRSPRLRAGRPAEARRAHRSGQ